MIGIRGAAIACILTTSAALTGCAKRVDLVFYNATPAVAAVTVTAPPAGARLVGDVGPAGKLTHTLAIARKHLPASCVWSAAGQSGEFTVSADSPEEFFFYIDAQSDAGQLQEVPRPRDDDVLVVPALPVAEP